MTSTTFQTLKEARTWLYADAVAEAVLPFRPFLSAAGLERLVEVSVRPTVS